MDQDRAGAIESLLVKTEAAHAIFERDELAGVYDDAWPTWYAAYAVEHGLGDILGRELTARQVADFFTRTWDQVRASGSKPEQPWSTWMARRLATDL